MWGSALRSEGGRWPQDSPTGSDPTWKQGAHGTSVVWKVTSGVTIVSINPRSTAILYIALQNKE
ncbi:similar to RAD51-like 1 (predicted), isoform CRA_c [Rattus norvegicus]|uniref:Similar to RAD51-like 1 (Predicted), isoform CRA_c n=1 Tax=Rattus norvegicus TaxID=10116 RepID=A6HCH6_RAT|nr:similar to RAD51-like 1 (predicted), isoform CRA_c [Rattus norvegicus]